MANATDTPLDLVIRFSTSNADIVLGIEKPRATSALALKQRIRSNLSAPASESRLRLIHAGKVLPDKAALSTTLNVPLPPPSSAPDNAAERKSEKAKGKQAVRDGKPPPAARVYIHCSIGDPLPASELSSEGKAATEADAALVSQNHTSLSTKEEYTTTTTTTNTTTTTPAPRGFDRLLTAGFTPTEITTLRTQFLAIQAHTHTPDTMPSGPALLALEERWLDNTNTSSSSSSSPGDNLAGAEEDSGGLEDLLWGNLMGFFWPVGAMFWLMREEGVWTRRRGFSVLSGVLIGLFAGGLRVVIKGE